MTSYNSTMRRRLTSLEAKTRSDSPQAELQVHLLSTRELSALCEAMRRCGKKAKSEDLLNVAASLLGIDLQALVARLEELRIPLRPAGQELQP